MRRTEPIIHDYETMSLQRVLLGDIFYYTEASLNLQLRRKSVSNMVALETLCKVLVGILRRLTFCPPWYCMYDVFWRY